MYNRFLVIIVVLAVLIVGGAYLYKQSLKPGGLKQNLQPGTTQNPNEPQPKHDQSGLPATPATTSGQPVTQFVQTVKEDAKETSDLTVTACKANPGVIKMKTGSKITIKNNDSKDITLSIAAGAVFTVPAGKVQSFDLKIEPAIYTYSCDQKDGTSVGKSGILYVGN